MAKVIFEFNCVENIEYQRKDALGVGMTVRAVELSPEEKTGPHDALACIVESMASEIIKKAIQELLKSARELGLEAEGELFSYNPDAAKY
ncbi:hypothetical protein JZC05_000328 [Salmonella enterica subsp. enterica serovar Oranienburg]|uniref:hypothetical protein n=1 Tax=Salmonella enterica TaxID=28901 RepID=UPI0009AF7242|nr:hypothetical protein [Salmonella enterica]EHB2250507.1 hypothetical protein [Salmonella enterica subsp. enterica serovar Oranienburg]EHH3965878.1 hypothetical protein [Salmonella enterica subsp. enterica serovar Hadar]EHE7831456.1 hypothetical protein [Salmonella enterica subsp. enterica serovar Oranienburg]EKS2201082.1 hypothetical protein [Salmonella enterica]HAK5315397.1 hypothetical protein [Salmonella enterica]